MGTKKTGLIKQRASVSKRVLPDKKSAKVIPPKGEKPSDRSKAKSSAAKSIAKVNKPSKFRKRAEEKLKSKTTQSKVMSDKETKQLIHELQVHQIELEMQNDERGKAAEALLDIEKKFRFLVENAPDAIFVQTRGRFVYLNPAALPLFGAESPEQLLGQPVMDRIHTDYHKQVSERIRLLNEEKKAVPNSEQIYLRIDGSQVHVEVSAVPITFGGDDGALVFVRDITERKQAEALMKLRYDLVEYAGTHSLEELLQKTLDEIGALTNSPIGFYHFVEPDQKTLSLQAWSTRTEKEFCTAKGKGMHYADRQGRGMGGLCS